MAKFRVPVWITVEGEDADKAWYALDEFLWRAFGNDHEPYSIQTLEMFQVPEDY